MPGEDAKMDAPPGMDADAPIGMDADAPPPDMAVDAAIDSPAVDAAIDAPPVDAAIDAPPIDAAIDAPPPIDAAPCPNPNEERCNGSTCTNTLTDPSNCGDCGIVCGAGNFCSAGKCCATGQTNCNGVCVDTTSDEGNCGTCGTNCGAGNTCSDSKCCAGDQENCSGVCVDTDNSNTNCGACGNNCLTQGKVCDDGICCAANQDNCGGVCTNLNTSNTNCGTCGNNCTAQGKTCSSGICCGPGEVNTNGLCCPSGQANCNGVCTNLANDDLNCGACGDPCGAGEVCSNSQCIPNCVQGQTLCNGVCINTLNDPNNCGNCNVQCNGGKVCSNSACSCPTNLPDTCVIGGVQTCVDLDNDEENCGTCGTDCANGQTCTNGKCCGANQTNCGGTCVDLNSDEANCGGCGNACPASSTCTGGSCDCGFNQIACNGQCITPSVDPLNCGQCGNACNQGEACVSNGCIGTCPPPTVSCPVDAQNPGAGVECVNRDTDNDHCGNCGNKCPTGQGCSEGACVPQIVINDTRPAGTCAGGGPPIDVLPTGSGGCTGQLAANTFTFALCSCALTDSTKEIITDGFDSTQGPFVPGQNGAGIGTNTTITSNALITVGGDLFVNQSLATVGDFDVKQRLLLDGSLQFADLVTVREDAFIGGSITRQGSGVFNTIDVLTTPTCPPNGVGGVQYGSCVAQAFSLTDPPCDCTNPPTSNGKIDVRSIVTFHSNGANNDNAEIGLNQAVLDNPSAPVRLDLPCGKYYLNSIQGSQPITIVAHGRVGLFIGGSISPSAAVNFDLDPTSTLDVFVGGVQKGTAAGTTVGSPLYPRLTRFFVGSQATSGSGSCTINSDCTSGRCVGGNCQGGGGNLTNAFEMSGNQFLNGLFYAGFGTVKLSAEMEMFGAVFAKDIFASAKITVHFDRAAIGLAEECNEVPPSTCTTCKDCNGQACGVFGFCTTCDDDFDCCQPLRCNAGSCELIP